MSPNSDFEHWWSEFGRAEDMATLSQSLAHYETVTVLGFDIFEYSQFELGRQSMVPFASDLLFAATKERIQREEPTLFADYDFEGNFVPAGDGGFVVFATPLQAVAFLVAFSANLRLYNSRRLYPALRDFIGAIELRSCLTLGQVFQYRGNFYGPALIRNARVLSLDHLDRVLMDEACHRWFLDKMTGVESLSRLRRSHLSRLLARPVEETTSLLFGEKSSRIVNCQVQKVGAVRAKKDVVSIYNVALQAILPGAALDDVDMVTSVGSSNAAGLTQTGGG